MPPGPPGGYGSYGIDRRSLSTGARQTSIPPKKGGSSVGVIVGAGCALLLVLVAVVAVGIFVVMRASGGASATAPPDEPAARSAVAARDLRDFIGARGQVVFVAELVNGGSSAVTPSARVRLFDARRTEVASLPCGIPIRQLGPSEKAPCTFVYSGAKSSFASSEVVVDTRPATGRQAGLLVIAPALSRAAIGHQVAGTVQNPASVAMRSATLLVTLYGSDGRIVGAATTEIPRGLAPGAKAPFVVNVADVAALPKTFAARGVGSPD